MKYYIKRYYDTFGYIYGVLTAENKFICDTLELLFEKTLRSGNYIIKLQKAENKSDIEILIIDQQNEIISKFVKNNTFTYKNIEIRNQNNFFTIGNKINHALLEMPLLSEQIFIKYLKDDIQINEVSELIILN